MPPLRSPSLALKWRTNPYMTRACASRVALPVRPGSILDDGRLPTPTASCRLSGQAHAMNSGRALRLSRVPHRHAHVHSYSCSAVTCCSCTSCERRDRRVRAGYSAYACRRRCVSETEIRVRDVSTSRAAVGGGVACATTDLACEVRGTRLARVVSRGQRCAAQVSQVRRGEEVS